ASGTLSAVSCVSPSFCVAVDVGGSALTWNGASWSAPVHIDSTGPLYGVSCVSPYLCVAVDSSGNALTYSALAISTPSLPGGTVGHAYSAALHALGGSGPYKWSVVGGTLPDGLTLN